MQHDRYFDDKFRDAGAVSEVKTSDVDQSNLADLTRPMNGDIFCSHPPCGLNINFMFFCKNRDCSINKWNILPNVRKVKSIRNITTVIGGETGGKEPTGET